MKDLLRKKAYGIMNSIESMNTDERQKLPSKSFGENYNRLHGAVVKHEPDLEPLMPPKAEFGDYGWESVTKIKTSHRYSEIHSFCSEIYQLLG